MVVGDQQKYLSCLLTLKVIQDEVTGLPTNQLSPAAVAACERVGSTAKTVSDVLEKGDHKVLKMIQKGIDQANRKATSKIQKVSVFFFLQLLMRDTHKKTKPTKSLFIHWVKKIITCI